MYAGADARDPSEPCPGILLCRDTTARALDCLGNLSIIVVDYKSN